MVKSPNDSWTQHVKDENLKVWTKEATNSKVNILKVKAEFEVPPLLLFKLIRDDEYFMKCGDDMFKEWKNVDIIDEDNTISYFAFNSPIGIISGRDFITLRSYHTGNGEHVILIRSVVKDDIPQKEGLVRGDIHLTGYYIYPKGEGCEMMYMTQTDLNGYIPGWVINFGATTLAKKTIGNLKDMAVNYPKYLKEQEKEVK
eukprot:gene2139-2005_t